MAVSTDFAPDPADDPRDVRFFPADLRAAGRLSATQVEPFDRDGFLGGLPAFPKGDFDGSPPAAAS